MPCLLTPPLIGSSISLLLDALSSPSLLDSFSHYHDVTSISARQPSSSQLKHAIQVKDQSIGASAATPKFHGPIRNLLTCLPYSGATLDDCSFSKTWLPCHFLWEVVSLLSPPTPSLLRCSHSNNSKRIYSEHFLRSTSPMAKMAPYQFISSSPSAIPCVLSTYL